MMDIVFLRRVPKQIPSENGSFLFAVPLKLTRVSVNNTMESLSGEDFVGRFGQSRMIMRRCIVSVYNSGSGFGGSSLRYDKLFFSWSHYECSTLSIVTGRESLRGRDFIFLSYKLWMVWRGCIVWAHPNWTASAPPQYMNDRAIMHYCFQTVGYVQSA